MPKPALLFLGIFLFPSAAYPPPLTPKLPSPYQAKTQPTIKQKLPATKLFIGEDVQSVLVGDFNNDKKQDLAALTNARNIAILLGDGLGSFSGATPFSTGFAASSLVSGDFNGDKAQDLIAEAQGEFSLLLGDGKGNFAEPQLFGTRFMPPKNRCTFSSQTIVVGDFNGDSKQDLAATNCKDYRVEIFFGDGKGGFGASGKFIVNGRPVSIAVGDVNNDSLQDLVTADNSGEVSLLLGQAKGSFAEATGFSVPSFPKEVAVSDINIDGNLDIVALTELGSVRVLFGDGKGSFSKAIAVATEASSVVVGDVNGDRSPDLITTTKTLFDRIDGLELLLGDSKGSFAKPSGFSISESPRSLVLGDFNGDGKQDLVTANYGTESLSVLLSR